MPHVSIDNLKPGMKVAAGVKNSRGQLLIPDGAEINEKHIRGLEIWGISSIPVQDPDGDGSENGGDQGGVGSEEQEKIRALLDRMFPPIEGKKRHPALEEIIRISRERMERRGIPGNLSESPKDNVKELMKIRMKARGSTLTVKKLIFKAKDIVSLPDIYQKLMEKVKNPQCSADDVAGVITHDPGLTARLLRVVNSAFYSFPSKIETVSRGVTILGTNELCDLALATSVMKMFDKTLKGIVDMNLFWSHSIACGAFARKLAMSHRETNVERYFVMGILHDIGRLILYSNAADLMRLAINNASRGKKALHVTEKKIMSFNHADVGGALLKAWNLPPGQQEAVLCHHSPLMARRFPLESSILHVADVLTTAMCFGRSGNAMGASLSTAAWDRLAIDPSALAGMVDEVDVEVSDLQNIFLDK
ncbi:MAG: HDOD domain-containing protein [Desulfobacterales bacterium]|nr:HDOD domain-containing protein [Desulfobacterales bacterium]